MAGLRTNLMQRLMAVVLTLCLSVCCCQARMLVADLSGQHDMPPVASCCTSGQTATPSCCQSVSESEPCPDERPVTPCSCMSCCIKGTGLKDLTIDVPPLILCGTINWPLMLVLEPETPRLDLTAAEPAHPLQPQTLLRLHCALIV